MAKRDDDRLPLPPYISFKTFLGLMQKLKETAIPERIDHSILNTYSGSAARQIIAALKYLRLIEETGRTTDKLRQLVETYDTPQWKGNLTNAIFDAYRDLIGDLNLGVATPAQLEEKFKSRGAEGQVLQRCVAFFIAALTNAGVTFSPHISMKPRARSDRGRGRYKRLRPENSGEEVADEPLIQTGTVRFCFPIPDKPAATLHLPSDLTTEDWEMVESMIRAFIQRKEKAGK